MSTEPAARRTPPGTISLHTVEKLRTAGKLARAMPGSTREEVEHVLAQLGDAPRVEGTVTVADPVEPPHEADAAGGAADDDARVPPEAGAAAA